MLSWKFWETVNNTIFTEHLETPGSVFMEHTVMKKIYKKIKK